ncbi:hypothetical protein PVAND_002307 [Polypedilum vanderplanki]|uniref:CRAL-TRIO domain-containing protein n=1 Tax=Polypedilum vanderplanki TaxID=319348 RepID=A0A9J6BQX7_POLVA|nr:hypothetical protein PVAND_002307 [Polypedilum vanderplanki]
MSLNIRPINEDLQRVAREQLFEDPTQIPAMINQLREWIKKSPHLKSRTDDQFLLSFLRGCKYSMEKTKQKLDMYYTLRHHSPEFMQDRDPEKLKVREFLKLGMMIPLPETWAPDAPRIILGSMQKYDPKDYNVEEMMKVMMLCGDLMHEEDDQMIICGQVNIVDLKNATIAHFMMWTPQLMKKMTTIMQEGSPFRLKAIHYINAPSFFEKVFNVFKQFLNEKTKSRIYIHGSDLESLYKVIPKKVLPAEYGGEAGTLDEITAKWEKKIFANRQFLIDQTTLYGVDEKKRIGRPKNPESLFGIEGSFRQLEFD